MEGGTGHVLEASGPGLCAGLCPEGISEPQEQTRATSRSLLAKPALGCSTERTMAAEPRTLLALMLVPVQLGQSQTCLAEVQTRLRQRVLFHD